MSSVHPVAVAPAGVMTAMQQAVQATGGDLGVATRTLRLLRSNLGATGSDLYVYSPGHNALCIIVWQINGACPTLPHTNHPGVLFTFSPGGPGYPNQPADIPAAVAGIAADNVKAIDFVSNGDTIPLEIMNNAFFGNIATPSSAQPWTM